MADEQRREAFIRRLFEFRATLPREEQRMLDALVLTAEGGRPARDVEAYSWFFGPNPAEPQWYTTYATAPGETSSWWKTYTDNSTFPNTPLSS